MLARAFNDADPGNAPDAEVKAGKPALDALAAWASQSGNAPLAKTCSRFRRLTRSGQSRTLTGPTGERNVYRLLARHAVLCLADDDADRLTQLAAVLAAGSTAVWPAGQRTAALLAALPAAVQPSIVIAQDWAAPTVAFDAVLHHGDAAALAAVVRRVAQRDGPIAGVRAFQPGATDIPLEALVIERALSVNTAAAGGNASLMAIG